MPSPTAEGGDAGSHQVVVVGAGVAGLAAALHLAERGLRPLVLEADPDYIGGRVAGGDVVELDGWRFRGDHGVHAVWSAYRNLQATLARHSIRPVFVPAQEEDWIYKRGGRVHKAPVGYAIRHSWIPAPFHYLNLFLRPRFMRMLDLDELLGGLAVWEGLMWGLGIDPLREGQPLEGLSLNNLVGNWPPALRALFIGLARNGLSAVPEEIPVSGFLAFLRFYTLLRRDAWAFSYLPADGGTCLVEPLADKVRKLGGTIQMGRRVSQLERLPDAWRVHLEQGALASLLAEQAILATDATNTQMLLEASPTLAGDQGPAISDLFWPRGMATAVVRIWFDRVPRGGAEAGIFSGDCVIDNFFWLHRIQDSYIRWHRATGGSAVEVHVYGPPEILELPDTMLLARAIVDVQSAFPELRGREIHHLLRRNEPTHTLFGLGPAERHLGIETPWPGLYCCGDWVRHPSPSMFMERATVTGIEAANAALRSRGLPAWPLLDPLPPEPLAGFIERLMQKGRQVMRRRRRA